MDSVLSLFSQYKDQIAAVILEPVTGNMGVIKPTEQFIHGLRKACTDNGTLLIFDEVMTGFRVARGGAQELLDITPDLTTLGKIIGGGLPVGAYGGKKEIMDMLAPNGPVYQAGTLSGNPMAMAAGLTTLKIVNEIDGFYEQLEEKAAFLAEGIQKNLEALNFPGVINRVGSMFTLFFTKETEVNNFSDVMKCDTDLFAQYFKLGLENGIYTAPSQFEAGFVSIAHSQEDLQKTIDKSYDAFKQLLALNDSL